jgi:hypothetical protein
MENGKRVFLVIIKSNDPQQLQENGIPFNSVSGNIVTARLTIDQIRKAASLTSVQYIESGSTNYPK